MLDCQDERNPAGREWRGEGIRKSKGIKVERAPHSYGKRSLVVGYRWPEGVG